MTIYTTEDIDQGAGAFDQGMHAQKAIPGRADRVTPGVSMGILSAAMRSGLSPHLIDQVSDSIPDRPPALTRTQRAAAKRTEKRRIQAVATLRHIEEQQREREAEQALRDAEDRTFWLGSRAELLELGLKAPIRSGRRTFANTGCVAILLSVIGNGSRTRQEIMATMRCDYAYSYRHAGYLLGQLSGEDPTQHLWYRAPTGIYHLHRATHRRKSR